MSDPVITSAKPGPPVDASSSADSSTSLTSQSSSVSPPSFVSTAPSIPPAPHISSVPSVSKVSSETDSQTTDHMVPVSEAIRFRKRAQAAEQQLAETQQQLQASHAQLNEAEKSICQMAQRQTIDSALSSASVVDMDVARMLVESSISHVESTDQKDPLAARASMGGAIDSAVDALCRDKPYLFRQVGKAQAVAMSARQSTGLRGAENAAEIAANTGNRRDLLRYLRLRRGA